MGTGMYRGVRNYRRIQKTLRMVENSALSTEEKQKVKDAYRKVAVFSAIYGIFMVVSLVVFALVAGFNYSDNMIPLVTIATAVVLIEIAVLVIVLLRILKGTKAIIRKVQLGQDGKSEEELKRFALSKSERKSVSRHKGMEVLWSIAMLAVIAVAIWLWIALDGNFFVIVFGIILTIACYVQVDSHHVEQHRIESGYYKKEYGFYCKKCRNKVTIPFHQLEQYSNLPTNEAGIRIMSCSECGNSVPLINFDNDLKNYRKYVQKSK